MIRLRVSTLAFVGALGVCVVTAGVAAAQITATYLDQPLTGEKLSPGQVQDILTHDRSEELRSLADRFRVLALEYDGRDDYSWRSDLDLRLLNSLTWAVHRNLDLKALLRSTYAKLHPKYDNKKKELDKLSPGAEANQATNKLAAAVADLERKLSVMEEDLIIQDEITWMLTRDIEQRIARRKNSGSVPGYIHAYHDNLETLLTEIP